MSDPISRETNCEVYEEKVAVAASGTGVTAARQFRRSVHVQLSGTATACSVKVQRSSNDPALDPNWVTVDTITGNLATDSVPPKYYDEGGAGWWRLNVGTATGGTVNGSIQGDEA